MPNHLNPAEVVLWLENPDYQDELWELMDGEHIQNERTMQHHIASFVRTQIVKKDADGNSIYYPDYRVAIEEYNAERSDYPDFSIKGKNEHDQNNKIFLKVEFKFFSKKDEPAAEDKQKVTDDITKIIQGLNSEEGEEDKIDGLGVVMFPVHSTEGWEPFITEIAEQYAEEEQLKIIPIYRKNEL